MGKEHAWKPARLIRDPSLVSFLCVFLEACEFSTVKNSVKNASPVLPLQMCYFFSKKSISDMTLWQSWHVREGVYQCSRRHGIFPNLPQCDVWCSIWSICVNKLSSSSASKMSFAVRDIMFNFCVKISSADESSSPVPSYNGLIKISEYVLCTLVMSGFAIYPVTLSVNAAKIKIAASIVIKSFLSSIPFIPVDVEKTVQLWEVFMDEESTGTFETRRSCLYPSDKLLHSMKSWVLREIKFLRVALVGGGYTAFYDDIYVTV